MTKEGLYGDMGAKDNNQSPFANFLILGGDQRALSRPEMFMKDKLIAQYEHNALHEEAIRKGKTPVGSKLTLWL
jgi:hypothetical protein